MQEPAEGQGEGHSYVRFSIAHHMAYSGWDKVVRYQSGWAAVVERDAPHELDIFVESAVESWLADATAAEATASERLPTSLMRASSA